MTAIVTDAHYRMSVSLIRDLNDRGVRVVACEKASVENPVGFVSNGASRCVRLPDEGYEDALLALCREIAAQEGEKPALLPVGAKTLALLSESRAQFSSVAGLCIASPAQLSLLNDKGAVAELAQSLFVPVPESFARQTALRGTLRPYRLAALSHLPHKRGSKGRVLPFSGHHKRSAHRAGISPGRGLRLLGSGKGRRGFPLDLPPQTARIPRLGRPFELLREREPG